MARGLHQAKSGPATTTTLTTNIPKPQSQHNNQHTITINHHRYSFAPFIFSLPPIHHPSRARQKTRDTCAQMAPLYIDFMTKVGLVGQSQIFIIIGEYASEYTL